ncbi:MAG TPA: J domain-containing protein [Chloroflexota bacterium]|nr:J domain-containing protein [Chloroflexota bacterium]
MRNSGWYIPFWRKPKRPQGEKDQAEKPEKEKRRRPRTRSEAELERVREEWITRYTRQVQAFRVLGLSVGTPQEEIKARYQELVADLNGSPEVAMRLHQLQDAYETLRRPE